MSETIYKGRGEHSVKSLEDIIEMQKEKLHLKQLRIQELSKALMKVQLLHSKHYQFHKIGQGFIEEADDVINKVI